MKTQNIDQGQNTDAVQRGRDIAAELRRAEYDRREPVRAEAVKMLHALGGVPDPAATLETLLREGKDVFGLLVMSHAARYDFYACLHELPLPADAPEQKLARHLVARLEAFRKQFRQDALKQNAPKLPRPLPLPPKSRGAAPGAAFRFANPQANETWLRSKERAKARREEHSLAA